jgi:hypothetical protein
MQRFMWKDPFLGGTPGRCWGAMLDLLGYPKPTWLGLSIIQESVFESTYDSTYGSTWSLIGPAGLLRELYLSRMYLYGNSQHGYL